jgi:Peptidase of plants and bacteria
MLFQLYLPVFVLTPCFFPSGSLFTTLILLAYSHHAFIYLGSNIYLTATSTFISLIDGTKLLPNAISHIIQHLYAPLRMEDNCRQIYVPPTRSVTLILRSMGGVAYTTGLPIDDAHKEIHLSLDYAKKFLDTPNRFRDELIGVVTHEMVHAYQWNALGTCPGGLIEGIADYVRLKAGLAPPHWKRDDKVEKWDEGYQRTAYFLEWLEEEHGVGMVARINAGLREREYKEEEFWEGIFGEGKDVEWLFKRYRDSLKLNEEGVGKNKKAKREKGETSDDGVLVELDDAEKVIVGAKVEKGEDGTASRR